jgi:hypothetical protein
MREFIAGGMAAVSASCITHPVDVIKSRFFLTGELKANTLPRLAHVSSFYRAYGLPGFYRGLSAAVLRQSLFASTRFGVFNHIKSALEASSSDPKPLPVHKTLAATTLAGAVGAVVGCPADVALVRMQAGNRRYGHVFQALRSISRDEGVHTLYRGVGALVMRGMLVTSGQFLTFEKSKAYLVQRQGWSKDAVHTQALAGFAAGFVAAVLSTPADLIKSRMMMKNQEYSSSLDCLFKTVRAEGVVSGLYKGFVPAYIRMAPQVTLLWVFYEQYMRLLLRL